MGKPSLVYGVQRTGNMLLAVRLDCGECVIRTDESWFAAPSPYTGFESHSWDAAAAMLDGPIAVGGGFTGWIDDLRVSAGALAPAEFLQPGERTETPDAFTIVVR